MIVLIVVIIASFVHSVSNQIDKSETVLYKVTGNATGVTVNYTTWNHENVSSSQQTVSLPWTQTETTSGVFKEGSLVISLGPNGGTAVCSVSVNGGTPSTSTASGAYGTATCDATG